MNLFSHEFGLYEEDSELIEKDMLFSTIVEAKTDKEKQLVAHVKQCIDKAEAGISNLNGDLLKISGMSSPKVRHFLNNLCSLPGTNYFEIGCWKGSTWCAALYNNKSSIVNAVGIDNWSEYPQAEPEFHQNCKKYLSGIPYQFFAVDCFKIVPEVLFDDPVNIYFYDGNNHPLAHERAFTYFNNIFDDVFIAAVDDWNWEQVRQGTQTAFAKLKYEVLFETVLPARWNQDVENWWNGLYVAVVRKKSS